MGAPGFKRERGGFWASETIGRWGESRRVGVFVGTRRIPQRARIKKPWLKGQGITGHRSTIARGWWFREKDADDGGRSVSGVKIEKM